MGSEWRTQPLGDVAEVFDGPHATPKKTTDGPLFLGIECLDNGRLDVSKAEHLSDDDFLLWTRRVAPEPGDVVFSYETRIGEAALISKGLRYCLGRRMGLLRPKSSVIDSRYLVYAYLGPAFQETLRSRTVHGSTVDRILLTEMPDFPVEVPDLATQRAIACILGSLDDKIELNRKMNRTLEGIARAIFKSWFVDFLPVRAKAEGRDPGLPSEIADLFPSSFVDSELGPIPEGWEAGCFGAISAQRVQRVGKRDAVVLSAIATGQLVRSDEHFNKRVHSEDTARYLEVEQWDYAYNPSRANIGSIGMLEGALIGAVSPVYVVFRPSPAYRWFLHFCLKAENTREWIRTLASGSVRQSLSYNDFASIPCAVPPLSTIAKFDSLWIPMREAMAAKSEEAGTLASIRDTLLPKLISGEMRVPDAERIAGRCV